MTAKIRVVNALLHIYPASWRREYGPELADMLMTGPLEGRVVGDVLWNGLRQRIRRPADPFEGVVMTSAGRSPDSFLRFLWHRKLWVLATVLVAVGTAYWVAARLPKKYRSEAIIMVVPPRVPESLVPKMFAQNLQDRLPAVQQQILSRTRLQRIIMDLHLYEAELRTGIMEDVVERMRNSVEVNVIRGDSFRVSFVGDDPRTVMRVNDRIASLLMEEAVRDREVSVEGTDQFLETQLEDLARRLVAQERKLVVARSENNKDLTVVGMEYEMMQSQYRSLFSKQQEMNLVANLERRQAGQQFKLLDQSRLPTAPFSPNRGQIVLIGAIVGLGLGLALVVIAYIRRVSTGGPAPDPLEEPAAGKGSLTPV